MNTFSFVALRLYIQGSTLLFLAYLGAGLGYILPMTFLPTLAYQLDGMQPLNAYLWTIVAVSCLVTTPIWNYLGSRFNDRFAIILSFWLQALGMLMVFIFPNIGGLMLCAIGVGCSFLGTVMCTQRYARKLQPLQGIKLSAVLITIYAGAQLLSPILAKMWISQGGNLLMTFVLGLGAFIWSLCCMYLIRE